MPSSQESLMTSRTADRLSVRLALCCALAAAAAACSSSEPSYETPIDAVFQCGPTRVEAHFMDRRMAIFVDGKAYALIQDLAASGARYTGRDGDKAIEFWNKGDEATLVFGDRRYPACVKSPDAKPAG
jgi:membrane-bound inhibitor of C-type lysozyme